MSRKSKGKFWRVVGGAVATVVIAGCVFVGGIVYGNYMDKPLFGGKGDKPTDSGNNNMTKVEDSGGMVLGESTGESIMLLSARLPVAAYAANGVSEQAESAYTLNATLTPSTAEYDSTAWAVKWENPSSPWATGKTVANYVTITPQGDLSAVLECSQAFGEQIIVEFSAHGSETRTAECTVDYLQRIEGVALKFGGVVCNLGGVTNVPLELGETGIPAGGSANVTVQTGSIYTIADTFVTEYELYNPDVFLLEHNRYNGAPLKYVGFVFGRYGSNEVAEIPDIFVNNTDDTVRNDLQPVTVNTMKKIANKLDYYTFNNYSVANKGLFFGLKYFYENLDLHFLSYGAVPTAPKILARDAYDHNVGTANWDNIVKTAQIAYATIQERGDGATWTQVNKACLCYGLNLFSLKVKVTGSKSSCELSTTFHINSLTTSLDSVSLDKGEIII